VGLFLFPFPSYELLLSICPPVFLRRTEERGQSSGLGRRLVAAFTSEAVSRPHRVGTRLPCCLLRTRQIYSEPVLARVSYTRIDKHVLLRCVPVPSYSSLVLFLKPIVKWCLQRVPSLQLQANLVRTVLLFLNRHGSASDFWFLFLVGTAGLGQLAPEYSVQFLKRRRFEVSQTF